MSGIGWVLYAALLVGGAIGTYARRRRGPLTQGDLRSAVSPVTLVVLAICGLGIVALFVGAVLMH